MAYETKFASLIEMCAEAKSANADVVVIADPRALGDTYEEIVESLNRIADAELKVAIVPRAQRTRPPSEAAKVVPLANRRLRRQAARRH